MAARQFIRLMAPGVLGLLLQEQVNLAKSKAEDLFLT